MRQTDLIAALLLAAGLCFVSSTGYAADGTKIPPNVPPNGVVERLRMLVEEDAAN